MPNMFQFICDIPAVIKKRGLEDNGKVQQFIDSECLRLCDYELFNFELAEYVLSIQNS